jgi:hypothetical protein
LDGRRRYFECHAFVLQPTEEIPLSAQGLTHVHISASIVRARSSAHKLMRFFQELVRSGRFRRLVTNNRTREKLEVANFELHNSAVDLLKKCKVATSKYLGGVISDPGGEEWWTSCFGAVSSHIPHPPRVRARADNSPPTGSRSISDQMGNLRIEASACDLDQSRCGEVSARQREHGIL